MAQDININIGADASGAVQGFDATANAASNAADATQDLGKSLEKQEARIKTLDGAINLLGGSVEVLAGGLAATGLVTKENAEQFQTAALGAIAFADGTKRLLDGYKSLNEGLKAYGGIAKAARAAQLALNKAISANPYVAAAIAIAAVGTALYALLKSQDKEEENLEDLKKKREEYNKTLQATEQYELQLLKVRGANAVEIAKKEEELAKRAKERADAEFVQAQRQNQFSEETKAAREASVAAERAYTLARENTAKVIKESEEAAAKATRDAAADRKKTREDEIKDFFDFYLRMLQEARKKTRKAEEEFLKGLTEQNEKTFEQNTKNFEARMKQTTQTVGRQSATAQKSALDIASANLFAYAELAELTVGDSVDAFGQLFTALADVTGEGNEEAFERGKKFKIAEVVTSSIQAAFQAFGAAQQFGPILGPILGAAQVAAIATASSRAIQDIRSSTFESTSAPVQSIASGGGGATAPRGVSTSFAPGGFLAPTGGTPSIMAPSQPIQAYVLASDVTTGVQAYGQISRRRRFG